MSISCFIASGCQIATTHLYRCLHLEDQLRALGHRARVADWREEAKIKVDDALACDLIFLYRLPMSAPLRALIETARALKKPVIFDTDDLIFEPELIDQHRAVRNLSPDDQQLHAAGMRRYLETLEACDTVVTATPLLAEFARRRAKPAYVHRNSLGREMSALAKRLRGRRGKREAVVIGYGSGTATHDVDFAEAAGALEQILERFSQVELWIAGPLELPPSLAQMAKRVRRFPLTDWREWFALLSQMDIALAPLERGNVFCRAKSEIKFVEAGALGLPTVASAIDPYRDAITDRVDGLLAADEAEWVNALTELIEQPERRQQIGERAREIVESRHSPQARTRDLTWLLPQLYHHRHPSTTPRGRGASLRMTLGRWLRRRKVKDKLTINWLVPEPFPGAGGDVGIFRIIRDLAEFGHDCQVYVVAYNLMTHFDTAEVRAYVHEHFGPSTAQYHRYEGEIGNADCTFATFWPTVENLTGLLKGGRRYYLVQDFEPSFYPDHPLHYLRAENTYCAGLRCITLGPWLTKRLRDNYHAQADYFDFAVDTDAYRPRPGLKSKAKRVSFYSRPATPRRAYEMGLQVFKRMHEEFPEIEIVFFGVDELTPAPTFPFVNRRKLPQEELAQLFSSSDVGVVFSLSNPSFVPLEMMACGCAVLEVASERWDGILTHNENAWLVEPTPEAVVEGLRKLLTDEKLRAELVANGLVLTREMSWRKSARQIERILLRDLA